jgi:hypothetical protein
MMKFIPFSTIYSFNFSFHPIYGICNRMDTLIKQLQFCSFFSSYFTNNFLFFILNLRGVHEILSVLSEEWIWYPIFLSHNFVLFLPNFYPIFSEFCFIFTAFDILYHHSSEHLPKPPNALSFLFNVTPSLYFILQYMFVYYFVYAVDFSFWTTFMDFVPSWSSLFIVDCTFSFQVKSLACSVLL